jgi:ribosomal protein S4
MSWNKYNLFNSLQYTVDRKTDDNSIYTKHLYAQRQMAKRMTRKYHGQGLRERIFTKQLYTSKFNVVAGGSADKEVLLWAGFYMNVERRLDTVIFRSLFASSIEQARQLIKHGHVDVNGMKVLRLTFSPLNTSS